ncbi:MAG: galactosyltransferase-related protein, partial [Candidatus Peribacteraceae bacterium]|nr:galactosyltransferase-related protein [Candidatus Peribacteraceae bacterium]
MQSLDSLKRTLLTFLARHFPPPPVRLCDYEIDGDMPRIVDTCTGGEEGISAITVVKNRTQFLLRALPTWLQHECIREIIIIDWSSKIPLSTSLKQWSDPRIRIIRVDHQPLFILAWAYNLAARYARHATLLKIDSDVQLSPDFFILHRLSEQEFISGHFSRVGKGLSGLLLVHRSDFFAVNGFNEHITCYGWDDYDLYARLVRSGRRQRFFVRGSCTHMPHSDRLRLKHQRLPIPFRTMSIFQNMLKYGDSNLWSRVRNTLEISESAEHRTTIVRYRELTPADYVRDLKGERVDYFRVSGNWGDGLLAEAGRQLLRHQGIPFNEYFRTAPDPSKRSAIAVIKSGGGLTDLFHLNRDFLMSIIGS